MDDINVHRTSKSGPPNTGDYFDINHRPKESNSQSDFATSGDSNDHEDSFQPAIVSSNLANTPRDWNTSSNFGLVPGDARGDMSDSSSPRHAKPRHSRTQYNNAQRRPTPHSTQPSATHVHSLPSSPQVPFENTQHPMSMNFPPPSLQYSTSPHGHGAAYIGQYMMPPQPTSMGAVHPPPYSLSHTYHHPIVPDSNIIPQNIHHPHYQSLSQHPHAGPMYQYQRHPQEGTLPGTGPTSMYPTYQANASRPPPSPHPTIPTAQSSLHSPSYVRSGVFHSLRYASPMSTSHYTYTPPFPGTPPYQSPYPAPQSGQHYTANRDGEPQGDWYYVPRPSPVTPSQQYDAGPYGGHFPTAYSRTRPTANGAYAADSVSSANSSTLYPTPPIRTFSQHSETLSPEILHDSVAHTASLSPSSEHLPSDQHIIRQSYHPNPPQQRSEWVMWAGNIPSDATHDEVYRFFSQVPEDKASEHTASMGVVSVFLISRSNCAFINFESGSYLLEAISRFNGVPLRADDARCARLVCRVRRKDDDLKAGVGGQRGTGMHTRWVKEQKQKAQQKTKQEQSYLSMSNQCSPSPSGKPEQLANEIANFSLSNDNSDSERNIHAKHSSTSDSYSSSNSNFLARHFPKRYFILKSLTQHDLDLSVQTGFWATQKHNEGILDQSYRTSKDVYLIFGVNKSGEFYGYARMTGPIRRGGQNIPWAPSPSRSNQSPVSDRLSSQSSGSIFISPGDPRLVDSPPVSPDGLHTKMARDLQPNQQHPPHKSYPQSAPDVIGLKYDLPSMKTPEMKYSLGQQQAQLKLKDPFRGKNDDFKLDLSAPVRAIRSAGGKSGSRGTSLHSLEKVEERTEEPDEVVTNVQEPTFSYQQEAKDEDSWGDCFAIEWITTEKLSFSRTRQIRNPWNHDREVKVSRDGTELEPSVGQQLLDEWHKLWEPQQQQLTSTSGVGTRTGDHEGDSEPTGWPSKHSAPRLTTAGHRLTREGKGREKTG